MDLAKFLAARLDEDEAAAKAAFGPGIALNWPDLPAAVDVFIDRYGPLRAVREIKAKRKILAAYTTTYRSEPYGLPTNNAALAALLDALKALAAIYSDHPDFDPA